ncbi:RICIN domain-containing protein [Streptomyces sp. NPDC050147]|uniref:RICIN domain-containing protein n=1 Tax=Streptomyces sp. NPDC050147 TaxID=3155513 RepID=UPI003423098F
MALLPDGEYLIKNPETDLYIDLFNGSPEQNTPIVGLPLTKEPNQKWKITTSNGINEFIIKSSVSGEAFLGLSVIRIFPPRIAAEPIPVRWSIEPVGDGQYRVAFPFADGVVSLPEGRPGTQLFNEPFHGSPMQFWQFIQA